MYKKLKPIWGLLGVSKFFSKFFLNDVESTILGMSERQRKEDENFFKEKNACHIIWKVFWKESLEMSSIILPILGLLNPKTRRELCLGFQAQSLSIKLMWSLQIQKAKKIGLQNLNGRYSLVPSLPPPQVRTTWLRT